MLQGGGLVVSAPGRDATEMRVSKQVLLLVG